MYIRQQRLLVEHIRPDVNARRSDEELAFFDEGDKIPELFDRASLKTLTFSEYPDLCFRWAFKKGRSTGYLRITATMLPSRRHRVPVRLQQLHFDEAARAQQQPLLHRQD